MSDRFAAIPFVGQGRDYDGADCWGLVWLWYRDRLGILLDSYDAVSATDAASINAMIERHKREWVTVAEPRDHDVVVMRSMTAGHRGDGHVGIVVEKRKVMHTADPAGVRVDRLSAPHVANRIIEFRRHPRLIEDRPT